MTRKWSIWWTNGDMPCCAKADTRPDKSTENGVARWWKNSTNGSNRRDQNSACHSHEIWSGGVALWDAIFCAMQGINRPPNQARARSSVRTDLQTADEDVRNS